MRRKTARSCLVLGVSLALPGFGFAASAGAPPPAGAHWQMVDQYCVTCHNTTDWAGSIALDTLDRDQVGADAETWKMVVKRMRGRLMPPPGEPRPPTAELDSFVGWMEGRIDASARPEAGYVPLHRLNRREYANAIRHLLGLSIDPASLLPQDDLSDGFDNVANVLQVSPSFLDEYLWAARSVAVQAVGNPAARVVGTPYVSREAGPQHFHIEGLPLGTRGGMAVDHIFPADGDYEVNVTLTLRDQMARHSQVKSCHACHGIVDPLGLALENFDGTGRFRLHDRMAETVIDGSGELPDSGKVNGPDDLRRAIASRPDQFVQTLVTKLMIYGTGRSVEYHDMPTVRAIVRDAAQDRYRFETIVTEIVRSAPFRMKQLPAAVAPVVALPKQAALIR